MLTSRLLQHVFSAAERGRCIHGCHFTIMRPTCGVRSLQYWTFQISRVMPASCSILFSPGRQGGRGGGYGGRGGGLNVQRESVRTAIPYAEKWFGACCGPTRRARTAWPTGRRGARVPGGLDQRRGSPAAAGGCADSDSLLWPPVGGDWCSGAPQPELAHASRVAHAFDVVHASGVAHAFDGDGDGDR